ncbi:hypothetical protein Tco_0625905 [Tanacetum coccineum]|uniref:Zinc finger, CCHC-type n=1 Tax=Tanacetum coccineum TaxID=301880 RepID=A0ABQ4WI32_9ASTR
MGDENPIRTLGDYSRPSHEGYRNTIELAAGNNVHHGESLSKAWTHFKDILQKVPYYGIDRWLQIQIFYDHVSFHLKCEIDSAAGGKLHNKNADESWEIIKNLALYDHEGCLSIGGTAGRKDEVKEKGTEGTMIKGSSKIDEESNEERDESETKEEVEEMLGEEEDDEDD